MRGGGFLGAVLEIDTRGFLKELAGRRSTPSAAVRRELYEIIARVSECRIQICEHSAGTKRRNSIGIDFLAAQRAVLMFVLDINQFNVPALEA